MTTTALIVMLLAWSFIATYTIKFFLKVLRTPQKEQNEEN